jgi:small subunit ribosomal protein S1
VADDPIDPDDDFAAMLDASFEQGNNLPRVGEKISATIVQVGRQNLILDLGSGRDGLLDLAEIATSKEPIEANEGDVIEGYVLRITDRIVEVGLSLDRAHQGRAGVEEAHRSGLPIKGRVAEVNKGGFVVEAGSLRCFCPIGAMDLHFVEDPSTFIGQSLMFRVTEMKGARDVVLSRRAVLQEERDRASVETRKLLEVGARFEGTVTNVRDFGAFVDFGGIEGLVPASEFGFSRIRPQDEVEIGQLLDVEVIRIGTDDKGRERITLSMRALLEDPFVAVAAALAPGTVLLGRVSRIQPFGAFVELAPGVDGLIHVSAFGRRVVDPSDAVSAGQEIAVRVGSIDPEKRRIGLHFEERDDDSAPEPAPAPNGLRIIRVADASSMPDAQARRDERTPGKGLAGAKVGDVHEVTVERIAKFGVFVGWADGGRGLVLGKELGIPRDSDPGKQYPLETKFRAAIVEIRDDGKVRLSKEAAALADEKAMADDYNKQNKAPTGLGTIGDLLKAQRRD